jgi:hypothetical protein
VYPIHASAQALCLGCTHCDWGDLGWEKDRVEECLIVLKKHEKTPFSTYRSVKVGPLMELTFCFWLLWDLVLARLSFPFLIRPGSYPCPIFRAWEITLLFVGLFRQGLTLWPRLAWNWLCCSSWCGTQDPSASVSQWLEVQLSGSTGITSVHYQLSWEMIPVWDLKLGFIHPPFSVQHCHFLS